MINASKGAGVLWSIVQEAVHEFFEDRAMRLGAALAFYSVLSLGPIVLIVLVIASAVLGAEAANAEVSDQMVNLVGKEGAEALQAMVAAAHQQGSGLAAVVGVVTLLIGATGVFGQLQDALNTIWEVQPKPSRGVMGIVKERFLSFSMVLGIGFLLLVSMVISAILSGMAKFVTSVVPALNVTMGITNILVSFVVITLLFAMIFKFLPDVRIAWKDVWFGAITTSILFAVGKFAIGLYLGRGTIGSAYGAAGSLVVLLLWVYYSSLILFFGAELTQVYADRFGSDIRPARGAIPLSEQARANEGMPRTGKTNREKWKTAAVRTDPASDAGAGNH